MIIKTQNNGIAKYNFPNIVKNDDYGGASFTITDSKTGLAIDITNVIIKIEFKLTSSSPVALTYSTTNGLILITDAINGVFQIISNQVSIDAGRYLYDCEFTYPNGRVKTYFSGTWVIIQDITNG